MSPGSGRDLNRSEAVERLWAAILGGSLTPTVQRELGELYMRTYGGALFDDVVSELIDLAHRFPLKDDIRYVARTRPDVNGDVDATLVDGSIIKFEVKAQTKKPNFSDITQSDWVRDQTDLLSYLAQTDALFATEFDGVGAKELAQVAVDTGWGIAELHLADLTGLTDARARKSAGVHHSGALGDFVHRKWFLHVTGEGARLCHFAAIEPIDYLLNGGEPILRVKSNRTGMALQSLDPAGRPWFTYHLYPEVRIKGRHKMHERAFGRIWKG